MIQKTRFYSLRKGKVAKGCRYCVQGKKSVIFVTGFCSRNCVFCPTSDSKNNHDVTYINERPVQNKDETAMLNEIIEEAKKHRACGAGLTGGDPLVKIDRTIKIIQAFKQEFGNDFHCHLYTIFPLVNVPNLKKLYDAGLDEIRFHPDLDDDKQWDRLSLARTFDWDVGVEIPVIPGKEKETKKLIDFISDKVDFLNLNELEIADNSRNTLLKQGFKTKDQLSYAVLGSEKMAKELMHYVQDKKYTFSVHFCTAKLKDKVQLANRIKRMGKYTRQPFEKLTKEGLLERGIIYLEELTSQYGSQKVSSLSVKQKKQYLTKLKKIQKQLHIDSPHKSVLDEKKIRIVTSPRIARKFSTFEGILCAISVEYPTWDALEIEKEFL